MRRLIKCALIAAILLVAAAPAQAGRGWRLVLPDTATVVGKAARLGDIALSPVPAAAADLVIHAGSRPNSVVTVSRRGILRQLVAVGLADGVTLSGAEECHLVFGGRSLLSADLEQAIRRAVQPLVPGAGPGAPASWIELKIPDVPVAVAGDWQVSTAHREILAAGRNLVQVTVTAGDLQERLPVVVTLHWYGMTGTAIGDIPADTVLDETMFTWRWRDLADDRHGLVAGPGELKGMRATTAIAAGQDLRQAHLERAPLIHAGDRVELRIMRGQVSVTVAALARQPGSLGQMIPVRNELTGRLVNARIAGPGLVEMRR